MYFVSSYNYAIYWIHHLSACRHSPPPSPYPPPTPHTHHPLPLFRSTPGQVQDEQEAGPTCLPPKRGRGGLGGGGGEGGGVDRRRGFIRLDTDSQLSKSAIAATHLLALATPVSEPLCVCVSACVRVCVCVCVLCICVCVCVCVLCLAHSHSGLGERGEREGNRSE